MATKTFEELKQLAIQIRDEKTNKQNTATRIGTQMLEHLNKLEQDYYDKTATDEELKQRDEKLSELSSQIEKYISSNSIQLSVEKFNLNLKISEGFLFIRNKNYPARLSYITLPSCDITISGDKVIAFSDTDGTYTPCTYGNTIYIVGTTRDSVSSFDVIVGINGNAIYSNYPVIMYKMLENEIASLENTTTDKITDTNLNKTQDVINAELFLNVEKFISVSKENLDINVIDGKLSFVISGTSFLFLKNNKYNQLSYITLPSCDITISGDKVIAFSDTDGTYTPCTYGNTIYIVGTTRGNVSNFDVIVGINGNAVYSNYPVILDFLFNNTDDLSKIESQLKENTESIDNLKADVSSLDVRSWNWKDITETALNTSGVVIPVPITISGYISFDIFVTATAEVTISLYTKSDNVFTKYKDIFTFKPGQSKVVLSYSIPDKIDVTGHNEYYLGLTGGGVGYINSAKPNGEFRLLANNGTYYGLCFSFSISGELINNVSLLKEEQNKTNDDIQNLSDKVDSILLDKEIEDNEYWVKVQGNTFNSEELYLSGDAEVSGNTVSLPSSNSYVALDKRYWSNRRIHKFSVTPSNLGTLAINMAQNKTNAMYSSFTGGSWTSKFKIDFLNKKIYMANDISFDLDMEFIQGRKYIVEIKYIRRIFTVTITDFLTQLSCNVVLDTTEKNQNGGFKNTFIIINESGNYIVEKIETFEVANSILVLFGNSVTEAIGRVGKGENYSEIITDKIKSCTIIAQGGAGAGSWNEIFENEIKYIKPKYCSYHMAINGGVTEQQLEKFVSDCLSIGTIPIVNRCICTASYNSDNTDATWNAVIDSFCETNGYRGYYGDIATAQNNDVNSTQNYIASSIESGTKWGIKKCSMSLECFPNRSLPIGTIVVEDGLERVLDKELTVVTDIHPNATGHKKMAERYLNEVNLFAI